MRIFVFRIFVRRVKKSTRHVENRRLGRLRIAIDVLTTQLRLVRTPVDASSDVIIIKEMMNNSVFV